MQIEINCVSKNYMFITNYTYAYLLPIFRIATKMEVFFYERLFKKKERGQKRKKKQEWEN